jgi:hypothetical protein
MAGGVQEGQAKWEAKMQTADANYQGRKGEMPTLYQTSLRDSGIPVGPRTLAAYQAGIARATLANVQGKGAKWARNYLAAMAR